MHKVIERLLVVAGFKKPTYITIKCYPEKFAAERHEWAKKNCYGDGRIEAFKEWQKENGDKSFNKIGFIETWRFMYGEDATMFRKRWEVTEQ